MIEQWMRNKWAMKIKKIIIIEQTMNERNEWAMAGWMNEWINDECLVL